MLICGIYLRVRAWLSPSHDISPMTLSVLCLLKSTVGRQVGNVTKVRK
jgi:hypothetical protein